VVVEGTHVVAGAHVSCRHKGSLAEGGAMACTRTVFRKWSTKRDICTL
jgi:hypothetical protein